MKRLKTEKYNDRTIKFVDQGGKLNPIVAEWQEQDGLRSVTGPTKKDVFYEVKRQINNADMRSSTPQTTHTVVVGDFAVANVFIIQNVELPLEVEPDYTVEDIDEWVSLFYGNNTIWQADTRITKANPKQRGNQNVVVMDGQEVFFYEGIRERDSDALEDWVYETHGGGVDYMVYNRLIRLDWKDIKMSMIRQWTEGGL